MRRKDCTAIGENLIKIKAIAPPQYQPYEGISFEVMCDVTNPLLGEKGAAHVYARQKGANDEAIEILENGAINVCKIMNVPDITFNGAGAAGGVGFGTKAFLNAHLQRGIDVMMQLTHFDEQIAWADIILTGEGRLDSQTAHGKLIKGIIDKAHKKPVVALCGALDTPPQYINDLGLKAAFPIGQKPSTLSDALAFTAENLEKTAFNITRLLTL